MGEVKSALEKAMEKIKNIEGFTSDEKEEMKEREKLRSLLAAFHRDELGRDEVWEKFRGIRPSLLREAQQNLTGSLRLGSTPEEFRKRKDALLALESLKERSNTAAIENAMNAIERLLKEYGSEKERTAEELRRAINENPQLRLKQVRSPDGRILQVALPAEEAVQARITEFLEEHEKRYDMMFGQALSRLRKELR